MRSPIVHFPRIAVTRHAPLAILWMIAATCLALDVALAPDARTALTTIPLFLVAAFGTRRAMRSVKDHAYPAR
ncbi:MAG: hypothetical protein IT350_08490 [Deltaproteobacteria bacterium]|nr:hypothetical protein [Deltaproteobacteria bacterium]